MNRQANLKRRRQMAASGAMPLPWLASSRWAKTPRCASSPTSAGCAARSDLSLDEIADKASVGRRKARELGLITVQNRGRSSRWSGWRGCSWATGKGVDL
jgi:hypothetical protein